MKRVHCAVLCFLRTGYKGLAFHLEDGQLIEACGNISVYEQAGTYQMYVRKIELAGAGELYVRYEHSSQELSRRKDILILKERSRCLPYPEKIGIVTALTGAAIEDIRSIAKKTESDGTAVPLSGKSAGRGSGGSRLREEYGILIQQG